MEPQIKLRQSNAEGTLLTPPISISGNYDWQALLHLLHDSFAYMETRIDPPSSLHRLTPEKIAEHANNHSILVIEAENKPVACIFLTNQPDCLYLGKLAVAQNHRGKGLAKTLIRHAEQTAHVHGHDKLRLETRIELCENHNTFTALGFIKTVETAHDGFDRPTSITMEKRL